MNNESLVIEKEIASQYDRVKGAEWFPLLQDKKVAILGQGGIGSWLTLFCARAGIGSMITFDGDVFETHNMTGQFVSEELVGENKADAIKTMVSQLSPSTRIKAFSQMYEGDKHGSAKIVLCGFDNMKARKDAFLTWKKYVLTLPEENRKECFFQDGRLLAEQLQIINIPGTKLDLMEKYEQEYLFDDSEVGEVDCTFKQTTHCAAMIASNMVGFLTNYITSSQNGTFRSCPFYFEYFLPLNLFKKV